MYKNIKNILVTGGAGFIGSHVVCQLGDNGNENIVVLDNLSTGFREAVLYGKLIVGDISDGELVTEILNMHDIDTVLHFAASIVVPESVSDPLKYYGNNTCGTHSLLKCCADNGVRNFIFSSTAAVYGIPDRIPMTEGTLTNPVSPYGASKLMSEWMLRDLSRICSMKYVILRYFNAAGCDSKIRIGQSTPNTHFLINVACQASLGIIDHVSIYGTDYETHDGTGIRDYIHVEDLSLAHLLALDYLDKDGESTILNCGYGHGYSVREVINAVERVTGRQIACKEEPRRSGDPPILVADASKIRNVLGWTPHRDDLDYIVKSAWLWEQKKSNDQSAARHRVSDKSRC